MNKSTKIERLKDFHEWLYTRVQNIYPMDCKTFEIIKDKIKNNIMRLYTKQKNNTMKKRISRVAEIKRTFLDKSAYGHLI